MLTISLNVNGKPVSGEIEERTLLVQFLREHLKLTEHMLVAIPVNVEPALSMWMVFLLNHAQCWLFKQRGVR